MQVTSPSEAACIISKGISKNNYYDLLLEKHIGIQFNSKTFLSKKNQEQSSLVKKLTHLLFNSESTDEYFENISKLIILILCSPKNSFNNNTLLENKQRLIQEIHYEFQSILEMDGGKLINSYFERLEKVSKHLKNQENIGYQQKLDYCAMERLLMRLYLKDINSRCNQD
ncbi:MAG: hypothetical protein JW891_14390 [Candidatus Lokiarchaeota archaeon]|nr:hypothetical protein [Candidatus Lokiarchaeota archaeon]